MDSERTARLEEQVKGIRHDVQDIKNDLRALLEWRWKLYGTTAIIAIAISAAAEAIAKNLLGGG